MNQNIKLLLDVFIYDAQNETNKRNRPNKRKHIPTSKENSHRDRPRGLWVREESAVTLK